VVRGILQSNVQDVWRFNLSLEVVALSLFQLNIRTNESQHIKQINDEEKLYAVLIPFLHRYFSENSIPQQYNSVKGVLCL
jgi:hypothetical protein